MDSKPHRFNSDFGLKYFLAGSCYTPDGAWSLLYNQLVDMEQKLESAKAQDLRHQAKVLELNEIINSDTAKPWEKMTAEADLIDAEAVKKLWLINLEGAKKEYNTIKSLMAELEPFRKYAHLPLLEATEASQREEWLGELKMRAENYLITMGSIPHDHFSTMRMHPDFETELVPHIAQMTEKLSLAVGTKESLNCITKTLLTLSKD